MTPFEEKILIEMSNLWHISRTAVAGQEDRGRYQRLKWCSKWFSVEHKEFSESASYKAFDRMTAILPLSNDVETIRFINMVFDNHRLT